MRRLVVVAHPGLALARQNPDQHGWPWPGIGQRVLEVVVMEDLKYEEVSLRESSTVWETQQGKDASLAFTIHNKNKRRRQV